LDSYKQILAFRAARSTETELEDLSREARNGGIHVIAANKVGEGKFLAINRKWTKGANTKMSKADGEGVPCNETVQSNVAYLRTFLAVRVMVPKFYHNIFNQIVLV